MPKVIQIRNVPDDVHEALAAAAEANGLSLARFTLRELENIARRAQIVHDNVATIQDTQAAVGARVDRNAILVALHEGREE